MTGEKQYRGQPCAVQPESALSLPAISHTACLRKRAPLDVEILNSVRGTRKGPPHKTGIRLLEEKEKWQGSQKTVQAFFVFLVRLLAFASFKCNGTEKS